MGKRNLDTRFLIASSGLKNKDVAERMGISASAFSRRLSRRELTAKEKQEIFYACQQLAT